MYGQIKYYVVSKSRGGGTITERKHNITVTAYSIYLSQSNFKISIRGRIINLTCTFTILRIYDLICKLYNLVYILVYMYKALKLPTTQEILSQIFGMY